MFMSTFYEPALLTGPYPGPAGRDAACRTGRQRLFRQPSLYLASDLFTAARTHRRAEAHTLVRDLPLETNSGSRAMRFSGDRLDQGDLDVFLACVQLAAGQGGQSVHFSLGDLLAGLGRRRDRAGRTELVRSLHRLEAGRLEISDRDYTCRTSLLTQVLLDRDRDECLVELNEDIARTFSDGAGFGQFVRTRLGLGRDPLARWLCGLLWTTPEGCLIGIERLTRLSGVSAGLRSDADAAAEVEASLAALRTAGVVASWTHAPGRRIVVGTSGRGRDAGRCMLLV